MVEISDADMNMINRKECVQKLIKPPDASVSSQQHYHNDDVYGKTQNRNECSFPDTGRFEARIYWIIKITISTTARINPPLSAVMIRLLFFP
jgi:hypothetical protein